MTPEELPTLVSGWRVQMTAGVGPEVIPGCLGPSNLTPSSFFHSHKGSSHQQTQTRSWGGTELLVSLL